MRNWYVVVQHGDMEQGQRDVIMREYCGTCTLYSTVIWSKVSMM